MGCRPACGGGYVGPELALRRGSDLLAATSAYAPSAPKGVTAMLAVGGATCLRLTFRDGTVIHFEAYLAWAYRPLFVNFPELRIPR